MKSNFRRQAVSLVLVFLYVTLPCVAADPPTDVQKHPACPLCGMDRAKFAHSRMLVTYDDGSSVGTCSIHCAAMDMAINIDKSPTEIQVGAYDTEKLIDAENACWVIGGDKMGVMTARAKWAFETKADADAFMEEHGGKPATFEDAMKAAFEDMYQDVQMIRKKRQMMRMKSQG
ncbi:MAG: nitrous oxide reductase accessory protein NosL [Desulfococcaceae bacterium]